MNINKQLEELAQNCTRMGTEYMKKEVKSLKKQKLIKEYKKKLQVLFPPHIAQIIAEEYYAKH